jgi:type II restriction/modification system DNA methylase subunit YeeA
MNTNALKKFAQEARRKLLEQVSAKLEYVLQTDTPELREKVDQVQKLKEAIQNTSKEQVIDKVTYTWFNRFMALRFMDANDYQPIGTRVLTPKDGYTLPALLDEAKQGSIPEELAVKHQKIYELLDGKIPSANAQNEAYKYLLIAACNHLNKVFPFLFERINDYTELLLPDDLTSQLSIIQDIRDGMSVEDCSEVEIVGWLYQFYISEKNEELISSKKVYKKEDLAPASQLFTPKWIVQYMVDNTLGQVWSEINPNTKVTADLEFYIKPAYLDQLEKREKKSVEEIKFFEPCTGSGHILAYAFDVFYKIYEEEGYNPTEIAELIITKNLYGVDIDQRAAQLASFVILMKGRQKNRRFLRTVETKNLQPNISYYQDFEFDNKFKNATALGSLIKIEPGEVKELKIEESSLFGERQLELKKLYQLLGQRYDVVVTNPPYISSSRMEGTLKQYVKSTYPETKSDLFATFILRCLELCNEDGLTGYMTPFVWMFISSYEKLREIIIDKHFINNLIQLEYSGFDGATVPICTFTLRNKFITEGKGSYIRLSDFKGSQNQAPKTLEAIQNPECGWFYIADQKDFEQIPGSPIVYWASKSFFDIFQIRIDSHFKIRNGITTGDNLKFIRYWSEVKHSKIELKWFRLNKGGEFRKWYGNLLEIIDWENNGFNLKNFRNDKGGLRSTLRGIEFNFKKSITLSRITSGKKSFRLVNEGYITDGASNNIYINNEVDLSILGLFNSKLGDYILDIFNPTINVMPEDLKKFPLKLKLIDSDLNYSVRDCVDISLIEWNSKEISMEFCKNELLKHKSQDIEETYDLYQQYWKNKFFQLHENEEELNRQFIEIYGLQDELTPDVPLEEITILKEETVIENGHLVFKSDEVFKQFMSYAVGCMFGRYSLDKEGLILANQGETVADYLSRVALKKENISFLPDDDNIIPVLDDEWFEDDIIARFYAFLKASFGEANFAKNLAFVEKCIGMDVRKYFVKGFYSDHIKRYKKRPIYWMFSSPKGAFNVMIYMHRYTPDTINNILNGYLREFIQKLTSTKQHYQQVQISGSTAEQNKAIKQIDRLDKMIADCEEYEREILYPLATERISIDLDDGVLVNYNKMGKAVMEVGGLNDKATKKKVREFDWINAEEII